MTSAPDGAGGTYVLWASDRDGATDIYLQRVTSSGDVAPGWPAAGLAVCTAPGYQFEAGLLPDGSNGVLVGWIDFRNGGYNPLGGTEDIYAQRVSSAGAAQWTANGVLVASGLPAGTDVIAAADGSGGALLSWATPSPGDIYANRVNGSGVIPAGWSAAGVAVCTDPEDQQLPSAAPNGSGGCFIAWEDTRNGVSEPFAQHLNSSGVAQWAANGISLSGGNEAYTPIVCTDGGSGMIAFCLTTTEVIGQRYNSAGSAQWTPGGVSVGTVTSGFDPMVWPDPTGGAYLCWGDFTTSSVLVAQRVNGSGAPQWTAAGVTVCSATGDRYVEDAVVESGGGLTLFWVDYRSSFDGDLYVRRVNASGTPQWTADGVALCTVAAYQWPMSLAPDGSGGVLATWIDNRSVDFEPYAQHLNSSGVPQLAANGKVVVADPGVQRGAVTVPDGSGGSWIVWHEKVNGDYQVRARRLDANGASLTPSVTVCNAAGPQFIGGVVPGTSGGVLIGWEDYRGGFNSDVYAQYLNGSGAPQWTANGVAVCTASGDQYGIRMVTDGAGSAILTWSDTRGGASDIYAQRLNASGGGLWGANGLAVCSATGPQETPVVVPSGTNGAIIAWLDSRSPLAPAVYGQRLNSAGAAQWAANGLSLEVTGSFISYCVDAVPDAADGAIVMFGLENFDFFGTGEFISTALLALRVNTSGVSQWTAGGIPLFSTDAYRENARLISDGAGGVIAAWSDARNGTNDIYAQRVSDTGSLLWGADAMAVCTASSFQWLSGLAPFGTNGAVLAWSDERSGFADLYAQRLNSSGNGQWLANGVVVANPARGQYEAALHTDATSSTLVWTDFRNASERLLYTQRLDGTGAGLWGIDGFTSTMFSLVTAEATGDHVTVTWAVSGAWEVTAYRRGTDGPWEAVATLQADGDGHVALRDASVEPGARYAYRIGMRTGSGESFSEEVWIDVPRDLAFAINSVYPSPARRDVWMSLTLPGGGPATLEVLDVAGRLVGSRSLAGLGGGRHVLRVGEVPAAAGMYFVRVRQGDRTAIESVVRLQ